MKTKKIGVLGLGRRATDFYLQHLQRDHDHLHLIEVDFDNDINPYMPSNELILDGRLRAELEQFDDVDAILIPNITLHETLDRIDPEGSHFPVHHAVRECITHLKEKDIKVITLFGSLHTMNAPQLKEQFEKQGIEVKIPSEDDQHFVDQLRRDIYSGLDDQDSFDRYQGLLDKYTTNSVAVIACTELSVVTPSSERVQDMARISLERLQPPNSDSL